MPKTIVHTFKARGNVLLEIVREDGSFSPRQMHREIQGMLTETVAILASKGIRYGELKTALTPRVDRREVALAFDTNMAECEYGLPIHRRVLPLLNRKSSRSILAGDYVSKNHQQGALYKLLANQLTPTRDIVSRPVLTVAARTSDRLPRFRSFGDFRTPGELYPHFHVLLVVPDAYLEPQSPLYITQEEWAAMWRKALGADGKRIIDIRVTENHGEVAKYVTKPSGYLELTGEQ